MWDCIKCGCRAIAASLAHCPMCRKDRDDMPKTTVEGGGTNAREPKQDSGVVADTPQVPEASEAVSEASAAEPEVVAPVAPPAPPEPPPVPEVTGSGGITLKPAGASDG